MFSLKTRIWRVYYVINDAIVEPEFNMKLIKLRFKNKFHKLR